MQLTVLQAAEKSSRSQNTIRNWIKNGKIKANKGNGRWQIDSESLDNHLAKNSLGKTQGRESFSDEKFVSRIISEVVGEMKVVLEQSLPKQTLEDNNAKNAQKQLINLQKENRALREQINEIKSEMTALRANIGLLMTQKPDENEKSFHHQNNASTEKKQNFEPDEQTAEKWLRENIEKWLDQPCPFKRANSRSWRELAENQGAKISINGKGMQPTRAYLHAIENWKECKVWPRMKARVALNFVKTPSRNHYAYPEEIGG